MKLAALIAVAILTGLLWASIASLTPVPALAWQPPRPTLTPSRPRKPATHSHSTATPLPTETPLIPTETPPPPTAVPPSPTPVLASAPRSLPLTNGGDDWRWE